MQLVYGNGLHLLIECIQVYSAVYRHGIPTLFTNQLT